MSGHNYPEITRQQLQDFLVQEMTRCEICKVSLNPAARLWYRTNHALIEILVRRADSEPLDRVVASHEFLTLFGTDYVYWVPPGENRIFLME